MKNRYILLSITFLNIFFVSTKAQWSLTGNSITSTNFLGSTNAQPLVLKVNNSRSGLIDYDGTKANTIFGYQGLLANTTGVNNVALGFQGLTGNTSGDNNIAVGYHSLYSNTTGNLNLAIGSEALYSNTTAGGNTAVGYNAIYSNVSTGYNLTGIGVNALYNNTTGIENCALGVNALYNNTSGSYNTANGVQALFSNTSGSYNTAYGWYALYTNTTVSKLTAIGYKALYSNTSGTFNVATGYQALFSNTTGTNNTALGYQSLNANSSGGTNSGVGSLSLTANTTGSANTAFGSSAMQSNTTGAENTATGTGSLANSIDGNYNSGNGWESLSSNSSGDNNTGMGAYALGTNTNGNGNTAIGYDADVSSTLYSNTTVIGNLATGTASNQVRIGNSSVTSIGGYANWTNISDGRVKKNIRGNVPGLAFINKLKPITYNLDLTAIDKLQQKPPIKDKNGKVIALTQEDIAAKKEKEQIVYSGFIAQDVEKAAKEINYNFSGIDAAKNDKDLYGLRYSEFVIPLVKAVQELSQKNDELKNQLSAQQKQIDDLKAMMLANSQSNNLLQNSSIVASGASLEQNVPNPFTHSTTINYTLPQKFSNAQIIITDKSGKTLKAVNVSGTGKSSLNVDASTLASGAYAYSLLVDGKLIGTKQMILTK